MPKPTLQQIIEDLRSVHSALSTYQMTDEQEANGAEEMLQSATCSIEEALEFIDNVDTI